MDDLFDDDPFDDILDITQPEGLIFIAATGLLDDEERCSCWCGCRRPVEWAGADCGACRENRHRDPAEPLAEGL